MNVHAYTGLEGVAFTRPTPETPPRDIFAARPTSHIGFTDVIEGITDHPDVSFEGTITAAGPDHQPDVEASLKRMGLTRHVPLDSVYYAGRDQKVATIIEGATRECDRVLLLDDLEPTIKIVHLIMAFMENPPDQDSGVNVVIGAVSHEDVNAEVERARQLVKDAQLGAVERIRRTPGRLPGFVVRGTEEYGNFGIMITQLRSWTFGGGRRLADVAASSTPIDTLRFQNQNPGFKESIRHEKI